MRFACRIALAALALSAGIAVVQPGSPRGPADQSGGCPELSGTYSLEAVSVRGAAVSLTISVRIKNIGKPDAEIEAISLTNRANTDLPYATFNGARLAAGEDVKLTKHVRVPLREFRRWESGGAPTLFLRLRRHFTGDPCGGVVPVDLVRQAPSRKAESQR